MDVLIGYSDIDRTLGQINPDALAILAAHDVDVPPGLRGDGSKAPNFRGLSVEDWVHLMHSSHEDYNALLEICRADFPTFCALLLKVVSKGGGGVHPLLFNNSQRLIWNRMDYLIRNAKPIHLVILKARQLGITTFMSAWHYWQLWRQRDIQTLTIGHEVKLAERIIGIMRVFQDELPSAEDPADTLYVGNLGTLRPALRQDTKTKNARIPRGELYMADRRSWGITAVAKNIDQRGFQGTHFSGSEAAFWPDLHALMSALLPQLPTPGTPAYLQATVVLESSPNGQNDFYDMYQEGKDPETDWESIFLPWMVQDDEYALTPPKHWTPTKSEMELAEQLSQERMRIDGKPISRAQLYYRHYTVLNKYHGDLEQWDQEYPSNDTDCFLLSSKVLFQSSMRMFSAQVAAAEIDARDYWQSVAVKTIGPVRGNLHFPPLKSPFEPHRGQKIPKPQFRAEPGGNLLVWEGPREGHHYTCGGDAGGGLGEGDNSCAQMICVTQHKQVAELCASLGPEIFTDHYVNLCTWYNNAMAMPEVNGGYGGAVLKRMMQEWGYGNVGREERWDELGLKKNKFGFSTQTNTKPGLISYMKWILEEGFLTIAGRDLLSELSTFQFSLTDSGFETFHARSHKSDDRVMALALALYAVKQSPKLRAILEGEQTAPSARDLGLNRAPVFERDDKLPAAVATLIGRDPEADFLNCWNPISGLSF